MQLFRFVFFISQFYQDTYLLFLRIVKFSIYFLSASVLFKVAGDFCSSDFHVKMVGTPVPILFSTIPGAISKFESFVS